MLRIVTGKLTIVLGSLMKPIGFASNAATPPHVSLRHAKIDEEFDQCYIEYFERSEIDGWEVRQAMSDILGADLVPEPRIIIAGLHACRRINDIALAIRWIEGCKNSCGNDTKILYPFIMREILPTMRELHIPTLEELYYDEPELALKTVYE